MQGVRYMISDASKSLDVEAHVLRYWEEETGLVIPRNDMGHRYYTDKEIEIFRYIKKLRDRGFQLKAIRILIPDMKRVEKLDEEKLIELRNRLEDTMGAVREGRENASITNISMIVDSIPGKSETEEYKTVCDKDKNRIRMTDNVAECMSVAENVSEDAEDILSQGYVHESGGISVSKTTEVKDMVQAETAAAMAVPVVDGMVIINTQELNSSMNNVSGRNGSSIENMKGLLKDIMSEAVRENNKEIIKEINAVVTNSVREEIDYALRLKEEREEERYRMFDKKIRELQNSRQEAVVSKNYEEKKKRSRFFEKYRRKI